MDLEPSLSIQIKICCLDIAPGYCSWDTFRRIIWPSSCQISFLYAFAAAQTNETSEHLLTAYTMAKEVCGVPSPHGPTAKL